MTYLSLATGIILCGIAVCGAVADHRNRCIAAVYICILVCIIVMLTFTAYVSLSITRWKGNSNQSVRVRDILRDAWIEAVESDKEYVCDIQMRYQLSLIHI